MKIGFFTSIEGWGGSETYLLTLMKGIRKAGHVPVLFGIEGTRLFRDARDVEIECVAWKRISQGEEVASVGTGDTPHLNPLPQVERKGGAPGRILRELKKATLFLIPGWLKLLVGNAREVLTLRRVFARHRVDVMHVSNSGYEVAGIACKLCNIPSLVMNMITPPPEPNRVRRWLMKNTLRGYGHISSQSRNCTEAWIRFADLQPKRCSFVWNGVDLSRFMEGGQRLRRVDDPFKVVSLGRLHPMKGYRYLIEAVRMINDPRLKVDIYGEGEEEKVLQSLIRDLGIEGQVFLRGYIENPEEVLREADCFVLPAVSHESCPAVVPEAMACCLPVITSDFGPLPEININGETGIVTLARDVATLADAIRTLMKDPALCDAMGRLGRSRVVACFTVDQMVAKLIGMYQKLGALSNGGEQ